MRSRFMEWKGVFSPIPLFLFFSCLGVRWGTIYFQQILFFSIPTFFFFFLSSNHVRQKDAHAVDQSEGRKEGRHIATSCMTYWEPFCCVRQTPVTWCKSLGLSNFLFWKCCYVKSRCESIAHLSQPQWTSSRVTQHPSIHPSIQHKSRTFFSGSVVM